VTPQCTVSAAPNCHCPSHRICHVLLRLQSNVFIDADCYSGSLDHTLVVVGYQLASVVPFWVVRNSWGPSWGDGGYMRMAMQSPTYSSAPALATSGTCGISRVPGLLPHPCA